ncbi:MAG: hypothetical protein M3Z75_01865 [Actinomycetota bacterium]|nr:hypothetical protein [Actinomycetota bacterium]
MSTSAHRGQGQGHRSRAARRRRERQAQASGPRQDQASGPRWLWPVMGTRRRRIVTYAVTLACAAVAGVLAVQHETTVSAPRARTYLAFDACLLTRERGLAGPQAAQAWAGLQRASLATHAKVEYLPVMGAQTAGGALPVLSSLLQRNCNVIIAAGTPQIAAVDQDAARYPAVRFATIGGPSGGSNVTVLSTATAQIAPAVDHLVTAAVQTSGSS